MFPPKYPKEVRNFVRANLDLSVNEIYQAVIDKFGVEYPKKCLWARKSHKKKGYNTPLFLKKPVGTERLDKDGYIRVIVAPLKERLKHHVVWEQYNPPIKRNEILYFLDGDKTNCSIENLMLLKKKYIGSINNLVCHCGEISVDQRKSLILSAMLQIEASEKELLLKRNNMNRQPKKGLWREYAALHLQGKSLREIAEITGRKPETVHWSLRRWKLGCYDEIEVCSRGNNEDGAETLDAGNLDASGNRKRDARSFTERKRERKRLSSRLDVLGADLRRRKLCCRNLQAKIEQMHLSKRRGNRPRKRLGNRIATRQYGSL
jgi:hypothetical protein